MTTEAQDLKAPREPRIVFVDTVEALDAATAVLSADTGWFAVDAERASGFKYSSRAYLIQIKRTNTPIFLIDPAALAPVLADAPNVFRELAKVMQTGGWILHAASQDLPCLSELGISCPELFDTELGSRIAGFDRVGLGAVCERLLGPRLAKEHSAVDWSIRPLHEDWLNYAALDVDVLHDIRDALRENLIEQNKLQIAELEFAHLVGFKPRAPKADKWRGVSGIHTIREQRTLAIIRELWTRREHVAERVDVSPGRLIPDSSIVAAAKANPRSRSELASLKDFNGRGSRTFIDEWWDAIQIGATTRDLPPVRAESTGIPNHKSWANRFPEADARLRAVRTAIDAVAKRMNLPVENLVSPDPVRQLCFDPIGTDNESVRRQLLSLGVRAWQIEAITEAITDVLVGLSQE